jgi:hypothetical protein
MVIKRSSSAQVARLLADLLGEDAVAREAAAARLAILGPRALDRLLALLSAPGQSTATLVTVLDVLERMGDPRGLAAAERWTESADPAVALAAIAVVRRALRLEDAAASARATEKLAGVALDPSRPKEVREAARAALEELPEAVLRPLEARFRRVPDPALSGAPDAARPAPTPLDPDAIGDDPEAVRRLILETGRDAPLPVLHRYVQRLRAREEALPPPARAPWRLARAAVHQVLAERGSRVALYDLRESLESATAAALPVGMLAALAEIGDASCLEPIAAAHDRSADPWLRDQLVAALTAIVAREGLTRRHRLVRQLALRHPDLVERALARGATGRPRAGGRPSS